MSEFIPENEKVEAEKAETSYTQAPPPPLPPQRAPRRGYRSLFWPLVLVGLGVVWLLANLGFIGAENISVIFRLWPLALIAIGLDLLVGRRSAVLGGLIGLATVAGVVLLIIIGPSLGLASDFTVSGIPFGIVTNAEVKHDTFTEPLNGADSAEVMFDLSSMATTIGALPAGSDDLLVAELDYYGEIELDSRGGSHRVISLDQVTPPGMVFSSPQRMEWLIDLSPDIPIDLTVDVGSGHAVMWLGSLTLSDLEVSGGSGASDISLPAGQYEAFIDVSSGRVVVDVPTGADLDMEIEGGSGSTRVDVGSDADLTLNFDGSSGSFTLNYVHGTAVQIVVRDGGSGTVFVPDSFELVDGGDDRDDTGTWQTPGFDSADHQIVIIIDDMSSGSIRIQQY